MNLPPDGSLSGEQPEEDLDSIVAAEEAAPMDEEQLASLRAAMLAQMGQGPAAQSWRPACTLCLNGHKIAIAELSQKLGRMGLAPGTAEYMNAMQAAAQAGAQYGQNPMTAMGQNGAKPDMIPPVRSADVIVNGTSCCMVCFVPQKSTSIIPVSGSGGGSLWRPGS